MNRERISELADKIEALPEKKFDMSEYMYRKKLGTNGKVWRTSELVGLDVLNECGTAGCIAGWAVAFFVKPEDYQSTHIEEAARQVLDLSYPEASHVFMGGWQHKALPYVTKEESVAYLRKIAAGGSVL